MIIGVQNPRLQSVLNKAFIRRFFKDNGFMPSQHSDDVDERWLGIRLRDYTSPSCRSYDRHFTKWFLSEYAPAKHDSDARRVKIKKFVAKNGRFPHSRKKNEKNLYYNYRNYVDRKSNVYNPGFAKWVAKVKSEIE